MMPDRMLEHLGKVEERYLELERQMALPEVISEPRKLQELAEERARLETVVVTYRLFKETSQTLAETRALLEKETDDEMLKLIKDEITGLEIRQEEQLAKLKLLLTPEGPNDKKGVIMEIRAGTGGEEAALFAADLFRMYTRYAQTKGWTVDVIDTSETPRGGFKEIILEIKGKGAYRRLKYESGVHRVQRIPITEASGRIHTSTATVAVLPEADEVEVKIDPDDLRIDIFHSSGAGGQNVNKVATAVRITHLPSGMVVTCQDERSQLRNKMKAMAVLRARLLDKKQSEQEEKLTAERRSQVGTAERADKIRTYNFPQDRITDHRIGFTMHGLGQVMMGDLDTLIDAMLIQKQAEELEASLS